MRTGPVERPVVPGLPSGGRTVRFGELLALVARVVGTTRAELAAVLARSATVRDAATGLGVPPAVLEAAVRRALVAWAAGRGATWEPRALDDAVRAVLAHRGADAADHVVVLVPPAPGAGVAPVPPPGGPPGQVPHGPSVGGAPPGGPPVEGTTPTGAPGGVAPVVLTPAALLGSLSASVPGGLVALVARVRAGASVAEAAGVDTGVVEDSVRASVLRAVAPGAVDPVLVDATVGAVVSARGELPVGWLLGGALVAAGEQVARGTPRAQPRRDRSVPRVPPRRDDGTGGQGPHHGEGQGDGAEHGDGRPAPGVAGDGAAGDGAPGDGAPGDGVAGDGAGG